MTTDVLLSTGPRTVLKLGLQALALVTTVGAALLIGGDARAWLVLTSLSVAFVALLGGIWLLYGEVRQPSLSGRYEGVLRIVDAAEHLATVAERFEDELLVLTTVRRLESDPAAAASFKRFEEDVEQGVQRSPDSLEERFRRWGD